MGVVSGCGWDVACVCVSPKPVRKVGTYALFSKPIPYNGYISRAKVSRLDLFVLFRGEIIRGLEKKTKKPGQRRAHT